MCIRVAREIHPSLVDICLQKARTHGPLSAKLFHAGERQMVDELGLSIVGDYGEVVPRDDDPVAAQITC